MHSVLVIAHVFAAVLFIGPATYASSGFPRYLTAESLPVAQALHRTTRAYGTGSLAVAAIGLVLALTGDLMATKWVGISLVLFVIGAAVLLAVTVPAQRSLLAAIDAGDEAPSSLVGRVRGTAGVYALLWVVILVLMITKP